MTTNQLLEILNRKFPDLNFQSHNYEFKMISLKDSFVQFYTYSLEAEDESSIWYFQSFTPQLEIRIPNEDTEFFFDYISEMVNKIITIEKLYREVTEFKKNINSLDYKRSSAIKGIID